jgi:predicted ATPase/class 3 adenylate cyclase
MSERPTGTVTFLFTDIEGSTTRWEHHPEAMRAALARHDALLRSIITASNGFVFKMVGDAVYAAFADAADAIAAAVAGQRAVAAEAWGEVSPLRVRMALHTGAAQNRDDDYFGPTLNRVARVLSTGYGDQILLSVATVELIRDALPAGASLKDLGEHALKDLLRPEHIFQLTIPEVPSDFPALKSLTHQPHNLLVQPTPFLGREQEVASVCQMLSRPEARLLTLTGPGGIGKTRLGLHAAAELADQFTDGVWFVALAPLSDAELVVPTIMQTLSIKEVGGQPLLTQLKAALKDRLMLLVLDNFEQVVDAAVQVAELLSACPKLKLIVTSRVVLHVQAEHEFAVPPLSLPDPKRLPDLVTLSQYEAVALFIQQAQAVKADFAVTNANAPAVAAICARLDGLPLAIELAAARSKLLSPQALLARLSQRLVVLTSGARDVPVRHQTLRNTIAWSYDLLEEDEKTLFRRLSVFVGGCTLEATEAICNANRDLEEDVLDAVARLVDKSLLRQVAEIDSEPRLLMLETIREYGLERLEASGEAEAMRRQHATFFLQQALESFPKMHSAEQSTWFKRLEADHDNLRAALRWMLERREVQMGLLLAGVLSTNFWLGCNHEREGRSWCERVLAQPGAQARTVARAKALRGLGLLAWAQGDFPEAELLLEESVSIGRELGAAGKLDLAGALHWLAQVTLEQGNPGDTRELAAESLRLFQELGVAWGVALALWCLGKATGELGDPGAARPLLEESAKLFRVAGDRHLLALPVDALGLVALRQGDYASARAHFEEALSVARETGEKQWTADALAHLGTVALRMGEYHESLSFYQQSLALNREQGYKYGLVEDLAGLAEVASLLGQPERAACLFGAIEALREGSGISLPPLRRAEYDRTVEGIRAHLDEATFAQAWAQGRAMPPEQVIVEVLKMGNEAEKQ